MCGCSCKPDTHHLIFGLNKMLCDQDDLVLDLCQDCHTKAVEVIDRIHDNVAAERLSKMLGQMMYERDYIAKNTLHGESAKEKARETFMRRYGRSYL